MEIEKLDLDVRTYNAVKRAGVNTIEDLQEKIVNDPDDLRRNTGYATFAKLKKLVEIMGARTDKEVSEETPEEPEEKNMIEITTKCPPAPAEPTTPEYLAAFNLNAKIHYCKDSVERGLAEMCIGIEQMRDGKQYKVLGYSNFEEYCQTEFGFSRMNGVRYADIGKMLNGQNVTSMLQNADSLGMTKLSLLAKLDEPTRETVQKNVDVESVTVKELKAEIELLQRKNDKLESETADLGQQLDAANENINRQNRSFVENMQEKNKQLSEAQITVTELEKRIRELEEQPIDHVMTDADTSEEIEQLRQELENERLRAETIKKQADALKDEQERKRMDLMNRHEQDMKKLREGYEKQLEDAGLDAASKQELRDEGYIKALKDRFEDVIDALENYIEDLTPGEILKHMKVIDEYYRHNLLYLLEDSSEKV